MDCVALSLMLMSFSGNRRKLPCVGWEADLLKWDVVISLSCHELYFYNWDVGIFGWSNRAWALLAIPVGLAHARETIENTKVWRSNVEVSFSWRFMGLYSSDRWSQCKCPNLVVVLVASMGDRWFKKTDLGTSIGKRWPVFNQSVSSPQSHTQIHPLNCLLYLASKEAFEMVTPKRLSPSACDIIVATSIFNAVHV